MPFIVVLGMRRFSSHHRVGSSPLRICASQSTLCCSCSEQRRAMSGLGHGLTNHHPAATARLRPLYPQQRTRSVVSWRMALCASFRPERAQHRACTGFTRSTCRHGQPVTAATVRPRVFAGLGLMTTHSTILSLRGLLNRQLHEHTEGRPRDDCVGG